ncbi:MAG: ATP-dependent helicase HrpA, partial [Myxococcota bacterium]
MNPSDLPIQGIRDELCEAMRTHQAVVIEGPTGCGKTTQVPQMLRDGGVIEDDLLVGVTQPRRIAAIGVAERIAFERGEYIGGEVSYAIRFDDRTSPETRIKVMTDGILLQEARTDTKFSRYGVLMVDEAHERSLNIDFTLGLLRRVLDERPDLKVVISSATINAKIFSRFFKDAPRIRVEARNFPVVVQYEPLGDNDWHARPGAVADLVERIHKQGDKGDILTFLTGEGEIKATMGELEKRHLRGTQLLPLYGRLTREEQERVFDKFGDKRKVILSTNIAETSITIDGVASVIDLGLAKVPSYDPRTGVSTLREEPVSKASASQRTGRAGRTAPGICYRLYSKRQFQDRPDFRVEEILRMDLSEVVLRLIDLGIHDVEEFPFVTSPPRDQLKGAVWALRGMGAIDRKRRLTHVGKRMVYFPLSPRLARTVIAAADLAPDVLDEVLTACALLSVRWPQIMPQGDEDQAREAHRHFAHPLGDLVAGIQMVRAFRATKDRAGFCQLHYLDPTLMDELLLVHEQLCDIAASAKVVGSSGGDLSKVVRCVATAFTRNVCRRVGKGNQYETALGVRVA